MASGGSAAAASRVRLVCFIAGVWALALFGLCCGSYPRNRIPSWTFFMACSGIHAFGVTLLLMWRDGIQPKLNVWVARFFLPGALFLVGSGLISVAFLLEGKTIRQGTGAVLLMVLGDSVICLADIPSRWVTGLPNFGQMIVAMSFLFFVYLFLSWLFETFVAPRVKHRRFT